MVTRLLRRKKKGEYLLLDHEKDDIKLKYEEPMYENISAQPDIFQDDLRLKLYNLQGQIFWEFSYEIDHEDQRKSSRYLQQIAFSNNDSLQKRRYKLELEKHTETSITYTGYLVQNDSKNKKKYFCRLEANLDLKPDQTGAGVSAEIRFYKTGSSYSKRGKIKGTDWLLEGPFLVWKQELRDL